MLETTLSARFEMLTAGWLEELMQGPKQTVASLAIREGKSERSIQMTLSIEFLPPPLAKAAINEHLRRSFSARPAGRRPRPADGRATSAFSNFLAGQGAFSLLCATSPSPRPGKRNFPAETNARRAAQLVENSDRRPRSNRLTHGFDAHS